MVAFAGNQREIGARAAKLKAGNHANVIKNIKKHLICPKSRACGYDQTKSKALRSYSLRYKDERRTVDSVQVIAMLFSKLKADANAAIFPETVTECVLAVPSYFSSSEQKSVLLAAGVAGLSCRFLIKETTALAIEYGFYKAFPVERIVVFVDFGHNSIQICASAFSENKIEIIAEGSDLIGGLDVDKILKNHYLNYFIPALSDEIENMKITMSSSIEEMPFQVDHLIGKRAPIPMHRPEMETLCSDLLERITMLFEDFLKMSGLDPQNIHAVEITGGSSRIPAFKRIVEKVFQKTPLETINKDEAVSRGCSLRNIIVKKKRNIEIIEKLTEKLLEADFENVAGFMSIGEVQEN